MSRVSTSIGAPCLVTTVMSPDMVLSWEFRELVGYVCRKKIPINLSG